MNKIRENGPRADKETPVGAVTVNGEQLLRDYRSEQPSISCMLEFVKW